MINLSEELIKILDNDEEYNFVIIRHNTENKCICWRKQSGTPDPLCPNCEGGGWIFNEWIEKCKLFYDTQFRPLPRLTQFSFGKTDTQNFTTLYLRANEENKSIKMSDLIYDIECTTSGKIINPVKRTRKWEIVESFPLRLDNNKVEFVKIIVKPLYA